MKIKEIELLRLAKKRQNLRYEGYSSISDFNDGVWECDYISPYSKSAHNADADVMVILQDWCSVDSFGAVVCKEDLEKGYTPGVMTNKNLMKLLERHLNIELHETYATNIFPYIKNGTMSARIPIKDLVKSACDFTIPAISIIIPKIAICLGLNTFNSLKIACGYRSSYPMENAIQSPFMLGNTKIFAQAHTGQLGQNNRNRGGVNRVTSDWQRMAGYFRDIIKVSHTHAFIATKSSFGMEKMEFTETITIFDIPNSGSVELICNSLKDGSIIELIENSLKTNLVWIKGKFIVENTNEQWSKTDFLKHACRGRIDLKRINLRSDLLTLSDTQVARKLGDMSLVLTMSEMVEKGIDVWGS